jgi:hypothetical protein
VLLKTCKQCGIEFKPKCWNAIFCSTASKSYFHSKKYYHRHKKEFYAENRSEIIRRNSDYCNRRRKIDLNYKIRRNLRARLYNAIKNQYKAGSAIRDLGCSISELKNYLESQFKSGMTWDNYRKWHIDYIEALANFDLTNRHQCKMACHYSNLRPMWAHDNISKSNR